MHTWKAIYSGSNSTNAPQNKTKLQDDYNDDDDCGEEQEEEEEGEEGKEEWKEEEGKEEEVVVSWEKITMIFDDLESSKSHIIHGPS